MNKVVGKFEGETDEKRFYVPGVKVESDCPKCGSHKVCDLSSQYLSYPAAGVPKPIYFYCEYTGGGEGCGTEWQVSVILDIIVKLYDN